MSPTLGIVLLAALLLLSSSPAVVRVAGEGAGESLADASVCLEVIKQLQGSSVFSLPEGAVVVNFNGTLYGSNGTVYVIAAPEPTDANTTELTINSDEAGLTVESVEFNDNATETVVSFGDEEVEVIPILEESLTEIGTILSGFDSLEGSELDQLIRLQNSIQANVLPLACQGFDLTPENETEANATSSDTVVFTTTDAAGVTITTTCIDQVDSLDNAVVRVHVIGDETEAYLDENNVLQGYIGQTFGHIQAAVTNLTYEHYNLTLDALIAYPLSPWDACIWDLHEDKVDLCIGEFFDTPERRELTEFSALIQLKSVVLVMTKTAGSVSFTTLMAPFSMELWACVLGVILLHSVLLWLFNFRKESPNFDESFSEFKRLGHSVHLSLQSVFAASMVSDQATPTLAEYWLSAGFALFIVVVVAAYTANLAAMMTVSNFNSQFESLDDLVNAGYSICVQTSLQAPLEVYAQKPIPIISTASATESLDGIDQGLCLGAVLQMDAMQYASAEHCAEMVMVGEALFSLPTGVPVRMKYEGLVSKWISSLRVTGVISNYFSDMVSTIAPQGCPAITMEVAEDEAMSVEAAAGLLIMTAAIFAVACGFAILERCFHKAKKSEKFKAIVSRKKSYSNAAANKDVEATSCSVASEEGIDVSGVAANTSTSTSSQDVALDAIMQQIQKLNEAQLKTQQQLQQLAENFTSN